MNGINHIVSQKLTALQNWTTNRTFTIKDLNRTVSEKFTLLGNLITVNWESTTDVNGEFSSLKKSFPVGFHSLMSFILLQVAKATDRNSTGLGSDDHDGEILC